MLDRCVINFDQSLKLQLIVLLMRPVVLPNDATKKFSEV